jgi:ureidoglycolate lyase
MSIKVEPMSAEAFQPFGNVIAHAAGAVIADASGAFSGAEPGMAPTLEWMRLTFRVELPLSVDTLEQHPFSDQTFLPQSDSPLIVFVCPSRPDGAPDAAGARAFHLPATMGVTFRRGVWHRSLAPLAAPSVFAMAMARTGRGDDSLVAKLDPPVEVVA